MFIISHTIPLNKDLRDWLGQIHIYGPEYRAYCNSSADNQQSLASLLSLFTPWNMSSVSLSPMTMAGRDPLSISTCSIVLRFSRTILPLIMPEASPSSRYVVSEQLEGLGLLSFLVKAPIVQLCK